MVEIPIIQFLNENLRKCSKSWVDEISCLFCKNRFKSSRENEGSRGKQLSLGSSTRALFCSQWDVSVIAKSHAIPFQPTTYKQKENWSSRQQQRKATAWHGWKPKPGEVKVESSKDDRDCTWSLSGNFSFLGGPLLLPSQTSCSSPPEVKILRK